MKEYALYKGEEILCSGTIKEIAKHQGIKEATVRFYARPSYKKRIKVLNKNGVELKNEKYVKKRS
jgi:hypothetical protein